MAGARYIRWHFAARRADCAAASSRQAHRRAAVSRRRRLDGEGARRATITWLQMAPPNDAEHMLTILLFFNRRADGARPVHSIRSRRALLTHRAPPLGEALPSTTSAGSCLPLFSRFASTMASTDFSSTYMLGVRLVAFPSRPGTRVRAWMRPPRFRAKNFSTCTRSPTARGSSHASHSPWDDVAFSSTE